MRRTRCALTSSDTAAHGRPAMTAETVTKQTLSSWEGSWAPTPGAAAGLKAFKVAAASSRSPQSGGAKPGSMDPAGACKSTETQCAMEGGPLERVSTAFSRFPEGPGAKQRLTPLPSRAGRNSVG